MYVTLINGQKFNHQGVACVLAVCASTLGCSDVNCEDYASADLGALAEHLGCSKPTPTPTGPRVLELGVPGDVGSIAYAINERGTVVGSTSPSGSDTFERAFRWDERSWLTFLPTLGGARALAYDVNDHDEIVGQAETTDGVMRAVLWDAEGEPHDLGTLGGDSSIAYAINNGAQVVGWSETGLFHPSYFLWDEAAGMREMDLGVDIQEGGWGNVNDINDEGIVVGSISPGKFSDLPFRWTEDGGRELLETLGYARGEALGINAAGEIVGYMYNHSYENETVGLRWEGATATEVSSLEGAGPSVSLRAINDEGIMVGSAPLPETGVSNATQWNTADNAMALPLGEPFSIAHDINNDGWVVGTFGESGQESRAFVWIPGD